MVSEITSVQLHFLRLGEVSETKLSFAKAHMLEAIVALCVFSNLHGVYTCGLNPTGSKHHTAAWVMLPTSWVMEERIEGVKLKETCRLG